jgi:hypothetical protein
MFEIKSFSVSHLDGAETSKENFLRKCRKKSSNVPSRRRRRRLQSKAKGTKVSRFNEGLGLRVVCSSAQKAVERENFAVHAHIEFKTVSLPLRRLGSRQRTV